MRVVVGEFERGDRLPSKVYFEGKIVCDRKDALLVARRLLQTAMLRGDRADVARVLDEDGSQIAVWNTIQESHALRP